MLTRVERRAWLVSAKDVTALEELCVSVIATTDDQARELALTHWHQALDDPERPHEFSEVTVIPDDPVTPRR
jgi:hypothetical protein